MRRPVFVDTLFPGCRHSQPAGPALRPSRCSCQIILGLLACAITGVLHGAGGDAAGSMTSITKINKGLKMRRSAIIVCPSV